MLGSTTTECYFTHPTKSSCHDLTVDRSTSQAAKQVLGLGGKFIVKPEYTTAKCQVRGLLERLQRDAAIKVHFAGDDDKEMSDTKLYLKSTWEPPLPPLEIDSRLCNFDKAIQELFVKKKTKSNVTKFQRRLIDEFRADDTHIIAGSDKGLGPCRVETHVYQKDGLKHLTNTETYEIISEEQGKEDIAKLRHDIFKWTVRHRKVLSKSEVNYLRKWLEDTVEDPYGYFYLLYKLHKSPISTRPVCSDCASLPHALGQWVDEMLQPIVKAQATYIQDSFTFKAELDKLTLPPNASIFTYDAVSMYTNIDTEECIASISEFLKRQSTYMIFQHYTSKTLIEALIIVMKNNRMRFGDILVKQLMGIAMGMSPAPTIANLFVAIHEQLCILQFLQSFIMWLRRFIDDGFGIWLHDLDPAVDEQNWKVFKAAINSGGLSWTFSKRCKKVIFLDLTVEIVNGKFETALYHKPLALHLYIPPLSCHAPGVIYGLVSGMVLRIYALCSRAKDIDNELCFFFGCLLDRGYPSEAMVQLFIKAMDNATKYLSQSPAYRKRKKLEKKEASRRRVFLHLPYHPQNPPARVLQEVWHRLVSAPNRKTPLNRLTNYDGYTVPIDRMVIAYSRPPNLSNMLSYRKIDKLSGPKVSSFL